ncbi:hypothetical protein HZB02_01415 [Candidatus Woesearchaeota archaeon]|nr:hypothetical protein [Candidatus Woesearchaeota archaeon]
MSGYFDITLKKELTEQYLLSGLEVQVQRMAERGESGAISLFRKNAQEMIVNFMLGQSLQDTEFPYASIDPSCFNGLSPLYRIELMYIASQSVPLKNGLTIPHATIPTAEGLQSIYTSLARNYPELVHALIDLSLQEMNEQLKEIDATHSLRFVDKASERAKCCAERYHLENLRAAPLTHPEHAYLIFQELWTSDTNYFPQQQIVQIREIHGGIGNWLRSGEVVYAIADPFRRIEEEKLEHIAALCKTL